MTLNKGYTMSALYGIFLVNVIGFGFVYALWCFFEWKIVKIKPISNWASESRLMFLIVFFILSLFGFSAAMCSI